MQGTGNDSVLSVYVLVVTCLVHVNPPVARPAISQAVGF